jgi:hypothetical protein
MVEHHPRKSTTTDISSPKRRRCMPGKEKMLLSFEAIVLLVAVF